MQTHCMAHRVALATAAEKYPGFTTVDKLINMIFQLLHKSPNLTGILRELQHALDLENVGLAKVHGTKWLTRGNATVSLVKTLSALVGLGQKENIIFRINEEDVRLKSSGIGIQCSICNSLYG